MVKRRLLNSLEKTLKDFNKKKEKVIRDEKITRYTKIILTIIFIIEVFAIVLTAMFFKDTELVANISLLIAGTAVIFAFLQSFLFQVSYKREFEDSLKLLMINAQIQVFNLTNVPDEDKEEIVLGIKKLIERD